LEADGFETVISCFHMAIYSNNNNNTSAEARNKPPPVHGQQTGKALTGVREHVNLEMNLDRAIEGVLGRVEPFIS
jgi:hypothetical protein